MTTNGKVLAAKILSDKVYYLRSSMESLDTWINKMAVNDKTFININVYGQSIGLEFTQELKDILKEQVVILQNEIADLESVLISITERK